MYNLGLLRFFETPFTLVVTGFFLSLLLSFYLVDYDNRIKVGFGALLLLPVIPFGQLCYSITVGRAFDYYYNDFELITLCLCATYPCEY